jgi:hypothetical protein
MLSSQKLRNPSNVNGGVWNSDLTPVAVAFCISRGFKLPLYCSNSSCIASGVFMYFGFICNVLEIRLHLLRLYLVRAVRPMCTRKNKRAYPHLLKMVAFFAFFRTLNVSIELCSTSY